MGLPTKWTVKRYRTVQQSFAEHPNFAGGRCKHLPPFFFDCEKIYRKESDDGGQGNREESPA